MYRTAHEVGSDPDLYALCVLIGRRVFECFGYTPSGRTIKFVCIEQDLNVIVRYLKPDQTVKIVEKETNHELAF